ncbi:oligosaccharide flippase family protein [Mucilaginibacter puniceus]
MKQRIKKTLNKLRSTNILSNFFNLSSIQVSNILLLLITIRLINGKVGFEGFGIITNAYRFSILAGGIINYGTVQSGVRDTAFNFNDSKKLSAVFYNTVFIRLLIFSLFLVGMIVSYWLAIDDYSYILLSTPIVLAEVINPLCFYIGIEKIKTFNVCNMAANITAVLAIMLFIKGPGDAPWVNFILGTSNIIIYAGLLIYFAFRYKLRFHIPAKSDIIKIGKNNFYLTVNSLSANLQQSIIIFALNYSDSILLGAYALSDRIIGQCRNLLNLVVNAVYPHAATIYQQNTAFWDAYRKKSKYLFAGVFLIGAILIYIFADLIIYTLSTKHDANAMMILRIMAFVPVISALNVFSMLDMLLKNNNIAIFKIAIILIVIAPLTALLLVGIGKNTLLVAIFTLIVEASAWAMYEYVIIKSYKQNA